MSPNIHTQKLLDDIKEHTEKAAAFADLVMKIMDRYVAPVCKKEAHDALINVAGEYGLEVQSTRDPSEDRGFPYPKSTTRQRRARPSKPAALSTLAMKRKRRDNPALATHKLKKGQP